MHTSGLIDNQVVRGAIEAIDHAADEGEAYIPNIKLARSCDKLVGKGSGIPGAGLSWRIDPPFGRLTLLQQDRTPTAGLHVKEMHAGCEIAAEGLVQACILTRVDAGVEGSDGDVDGVRGLIYHDQLLMPAHLDTTRVRDVGVDRDRDPRAFGHAADPCRRFLGVRCRQYVWSQRCFTRARGLHG